MAPSPTVRRLLKETAELSSPSSNPNPAFFAAPVSDADLHEWHFTLLGPPAPSPYAGGLYHGRITLPATYPLKPPNFRFLTASGRFEVNREICLSISGFHEETWMPAWGVRTALTALRSFMAEKGSAGQVGGLEASVEVRKRLAKESRSWKCEACGKSNEMVMREWWDVCRQAGVNVLEEDLGLESLPEGMTLEARDPNADSKSPKKEESSGTESPAEGITSSQRRNHSAIPSPESQQTLISSDPSQPSEPPSDSRDAASNLRAPSQASIPFVPTPTAEAVQASAEAILTPSDLSLPPSSSNTPHRPLMSSIHAPPLAAANAALSQPRPLLLQRDRDREQTITIDRAIAGVFLALCLMVLKKIFYPSGTGQGVVEDFYLQRE